MFKIDAAPSFLIMRKFKKNKNKLLHDIIEYTYVRMHRDVHTNLKPVHCIKIHVQIQKIN